MHDGRGMRNEQICRLSCRADGKRETETERESERERARRREKESASRAPYMVHRKMISIHRNRRGRASAGRARESEREKESAREIVIHERFEIIHAPHMCHSRPDLLATRERRALRKIGGAAFGQRRKDSKIAAGYSITSREGISCSVFIYLFFFFSFRPERTQRNAAV